MKFFLVGFAFVAVAAASTLSHDNGLPVEYLPPQELSLPEPNNQYLSPIEAAEPIAQLADDGYRYKTVKRLRHRVRRDVSELSQYLPPVQQEPAGYGYPAPAPVGIAAPVDVEAPIEVEAPREIAAPVQETAELASDGYRYKTVKRIRYRTRRDVNELPASDYLPPTELAIEEPVNQYLAPAEIAEPIEQIAEDGYRYKTVKRLRHRIRRDVSELPSNEYLAPAQSNAGYAYPSPAPVEIPASAEVEIAAPLEAPAEIEISAPAPEEPSAELASDGYRYKTIRRIRYRHRRDVNELPVEYLPPQELSLPEPSNQYLAPIEAAEPIEQLADDGYRYKTVKRLRHRHRRDVNELASAEYLPPVQEPAGYSYPAPAPVEIPAPIEIPAPVELADDGYRYKTVRRIRYRHRRDVSELPSSDYLPPVQQESGYTYPAPVRAEIAAPALVEIPTPVEIAAPAPIEQAVELADDGYRYKTVRRIRYRHRRDVSELPLSDYLPPVAAVPQSGYSYPAPALIEVAAPLADDGYRYKTVRRIRYRKRRDVSELPTEYLPPQELSLPEPNNQYLAPIEAVEPIEQLSDDGYRYKTVKRLRHRSRRDVSELSQYLPPIQQEAGYSYPAPIELASDGYRYKTVKRLRYRHRRDVNELLSGEYLPPGQELGLPEPSNEYLAPAVEQPIEQIAEDGYRYKTVKKYKIKRH